MMPTTGMISSIGAVANSHHSADPANNAACYPANNAAHEAADGPKHLISGARTSTGTMAGAWSDTLSARGGRYGSERDDPNNKFQRPFISYLPLLPIRMHIVTLASQSG